MFTLLLHKGPIELPEYLYKKPVCVLLIILFKRHLQNDPANDIELRSAPQLTKVLCLRTQNLMRQQGLYQLDRKDALGVRHD